MNKPTLFLRLLGRSIVLGLIAGGVLSLIIGLVCGLAFGLWAFGLALLVGIGSGLALGLINGLLIGAITCFWFVPVQNERCYRQVIGTACIVTSIVILLPTYFAALSVFAGPAAWWGSQFVCDYYLSGTEAIPMAEV